MPKCYLVIIRPLHLVLSSCIFRSAAAQYDAVEPSAYELGGKGHGPMVDMMHPEGHEGGKCGCYKSTLVTSIVSMYEAGKY